MDPNATGVRFTNVLAGDMSLTNAVAHNGSGVALGDVDGDGWADIYFCNLQGPNQLYRNLGRWRFEPMNLGEAACPGQLSTGAAFADVDGDGDLDLLVNGIAAGTRLFLNDGRGKFTEAINSGLSRTASATSLTLADIDGDGDLDLYCVHYIDEMHLADPTTRFGLARRGDLWTVTSVNGESTRSGRLQDRFVVSPTGRVRELPEADGLYRNDGHGHFTAIQFEPGVFLDEQGKPIPPFRDWGLAAMFRDFTGDGAPDLYVCNDNASPDRIWINTGKGAFRAIEPLKLRHTSRSSMGIDFADINRDGIDDYIVLDMLAREHGKRMTQLVKDHPDPAEREQIDARPRYNRNMLFLGRPDGSFAEAALMAGVAATDWSWCPIFLDVDLDGYEDLLVSNGFSFDVMDQDSHNQLRAASRNLSREQMKRSRQFHPRWATANAAFRNRGDGTFDPMDRTWGFDRPGISNGMALADLDNDGDLDLVVNNLNDTAGLFRNDAAANRIAVRLKGTPPNTQGIGARIRVTGLSMVQSQEMICGGRYLSGDQAVRVFAAGDATNRLTIEVVWRDGRRSIVSNAVPNCVYEIDEAGAGNSRSPIANSQSSTVRDQSFVVRGQGRAGSITNDALRILHDSSPLFQDVSDLLSHSHREAALDDWAEQPLLPRRLSRLGPGLSWFDVDGDGWEDLIVGAGRGGKLGVFVNERGNGFRKLDSAAALEAEQGTTVGWPDGQGHRKWLVTISAIAPAPNRGSEIAIYTSTNRTASQRLPMGPEIAGPLAVADVDGDGDLDLFVGGRYLPGRYPEPVSSAIWLNEAGELRRSAASSEPFQAVGLVSGATFADLDGDGAPDLVLACEWGPIRIFHNDSGILKPWDWQVVQDPNSPTDQGPRTKDQGPKTKDRGPRFTLRNLTGLWTSVVAGDFDGDGKLDLAVGNWGQNSIYQLHRPGPLRLFYGDWNSDGKAEMIEAWQSGGTWRPVRDRTWLARGLPELLNRFPTHEAFGAAAVSDLLGERFTGAGIVEATELSSGVFLNRSSSFEWVPLPAEAQLSPAFSMNVGDFDGDGIEDLFLSQNFFGWASDLSRDDSGRGLWLRGNGSGRFSAVDASVTGIAMAGEQRGAALADFNHDGRVDLAVAQNNAATKLYLNRGGKRGWRVMLKGPPSNPDGVGALLRVRYADGSAGPVRAVQGGSGYWSQDGSAQVLGLRESPVALWVRWPGGREQTIRLDKPVWQIEVAY